MTTEILVIKIIFLGAPGWVSQLSKCPTLDFGPGHDLTVVSLSPASGSMLGVSLLDSLSLHLPLPLPIFLSQKRKIKQEEYHMSSSKKEEYLLRTHSRSCTYNFTYIPLSRICAETLLAEDRMRNESLSWTVLCTDQD